MSQNDISPWNGYRTVGPPEYTLFLLVYLKYFNKKIYKSDCYRTKLSIFAMLISNMLYQVERNVPHFHRPYLVITQPQFRLHLIQKKKIKFQIETAVGCVCYRTKYLPQSLCENTQMFINTNFRLKTIINKESFRTVRLRVFSSHDYRFGRIIFHIQWISYVGGIFNPQCNCFDPLKRVWQNDNRSGGGVKPLLIVPL